MPLFRDKDLVSRVQRKLPFLFELAEAESRRATKVGMEVGSKREQILVALLIYKFGHENVKIDIPITSPEVDVIVLGQPLSIKTVTDNGGVKVVWTVDWQSVDDFVQRYEPTYDMLLAQIRWGSQGGLFLIPKEVQALVFGELGKESYLRTPKRGTNPRGVEISRLALEKMLGIAPQWKIPILWQRSTKQIPDPYERWLDYWRED